MSTSDLFSLSVAREVTVFLDRNYLRECVCFLSFKTDPASIGGQRLLHIADINISSCVTSFFRCRVKTEKTGDKPKDLRQASWFGKEV